MAADDSEIAFVHAAGFEEFAIGADCAGTFSEEEDAGGFGIETMDVTEKAEIAGTSPESATNYGGRDGELEIATGFVPVVGDEHPAGGFVDGQDGAVLVEDGKGGAVGEDNLVRVARGSWTRHRERLEAISQMSKLRLAVLLTGCFFAPQSQITSDMLRRRASHPAKIPRDPQPAHL